jgi:hypothetical protein
VDAGAGRHPRLRLNTKSKQFFFEKKNQKTFDSVPRGFGAGGGS